MAERTIEYKLQAVNYTGPAFASVQAGLQRLAAQQNTLTQTMQRGATAAAAGFTRMAQAASTAAARIGSALKSIEGGLSRVVSAAGGLAAKLGGLGGLAGGLTVAGSIGAVATAGVRMNVTLETARIALTAMSGSAKLAANLIADLQKEAVFSKLTFQEMLPVAQSLVAVLGTKGMGSIVPIMRAFGDVAAGVGAGAAEMGLALAGFRQLIGVGGLSEMNVRQITNALPGFKGFEAIHQRFGTAETKDLLAMGVTGMDVGETLVRAMQTGPFAGMQKKLAGTLPMLTSGITDQLNALSAQVTGGFTERLRSALMTVSKFLANIQSSPQGAKLLEVVTRMFDKLGDVLVQVANNLPGIVGWLADLPDKIMPLWTKMQSVVIQAVKIIGGAIAGLGAFMTTMFPGSGAAPGGQGIGGESKPGMGDLRLRDEQALNRLKPTGFGAPGSHMDNMVKLWRDMEKLWGKRRQNRQPGKMYTLGTYGTTDHVDPANAAIGNALKGVGLGGGGGTVPVDRLNAALNDAAAAAKRFGAVVDEFVGTLTKLTKPPTPAAPKGLGPFNDIPVMPGASGKDVPRMIAAAERNRLLQGRGGSAVGRGRSWIEYSEEGDRRHMSQAYRNRAGYSNTYDPMMRSDPYNRWLAGFQLGRPEAGALPPTGGSQNWNEFSAAGDRTRMSRTTRNRAGYSNTYDPMMTADPYNRALAAFSGDRQITINIQAGAGPEQILEVVMRELRKVLVAPSR